MQLHEVSSAKRQDGLTQRVPMDQGSTTFTGLDASQNYEASVGTVSVSGVVGPGQYPHHTIKTKACCAHCWCVHSDKFVVMHTPYTVSERQSAPPAVRPVATDLSTTIIIAVSVVVVLLAAMVFATVIIVVALRSRRSTADLTKESR